MELALLVVGAYLCGSIPTGVWLARRHGVDPRDIGSGNIGANNVLRAAGPLTGGLTLLGDLGKGLVPVLVAQRLGVGPSGVALAALAAFLGHLYSCFLGFDGGKGVATALGALLGMAPFAMAIALPLFALVLGLSRYVSLASLLTAIVTPVLLMALAYPTPTIAVAIAMSVGIAVRHRDNVRRIRFGTEGRVGERRAAPADSGVA